jgi:hypothetical protein
MTDLPLPLRSRLSLLRRSDDLALSSLYSARLARLTRSLLGMMCSPRLQSLLLGFYDPCYGERKVLSIEYSFRGEMHRAEVGDTQAVVAPLRGELYHLHSYVPFSLSVFDQMRERRFAVCARGVLDSFAGILYLLAL